MREAVERATTGDAAQTQSRPDTAGTDSVTRSFRHEPTPLTLAPAFVANDDDQYHVADLLKFSDAEFVNAAYRAILKREPDAAGRRFYLDGLRQGRFDRLHVIITLRSSEEGERRNVRIEGLTLPLWLRRVNALPLVGPLLRYGIDFLRAPILIRRLEHSTSMAQARNQQIAEHVNVTNRESTSALTEGLAAINDTVADASLALNYQHDRMRTQVSAIKSELTASIVNSAATTEARLREVLDSAIADNARAMATHAQTTESKIADVRGELGRFSGDISTLQSLAREAGTELKSSAADAQRLRQELAIQRARLALLEQIAQSLPSSAHNVETLKTVAETAHHLDALYVELEDRFRGSREALRQLFEFYLPYVQSLPHDDLPIVDLGCGRGEWIELLNEHGCKSVGVDNNRVMIESCRERDLPITESDALDYLRGLPENSLRAVTAFHLIEHLHTDVLIALLDEITRALHAGGAAIFETPNPDNLFVASNYFYHDPTHRHPLPSPLAKFLLESRGLHRVEVINLHECSEGRFTGSDEISARLNELFYGPMDYAIVGWKLDQ
jgi:O-antigen chain-terminating methyltransferase